MLTLTDSIEIKATPEKVYDWLMQRMKDKESYQAWHPDHVDVRWIKGEPLHEGSILYAEEYLHGQLHKLKFRITKIVPNREIKYRTLFPLSFFVPGNTFLIEPKGEDSCIFTATGDFRAGPLFKKLGKSRIEATRQHMKEEGENLKKALERDLGKLSA
ncbi:MAG: SRPBCC family protein [Candidatus Hermodarchaeota archaeon]